MRVFFLVYSSLMFYYEKGMLKVSEGLIFNLFIINQYCTPKIYYYEFYETSVKGCVFKLFHFSLFSYIFSNWCISTNYIEIPRTDTFWLYSSNFIKFLWATFFSFFINFYMTSIRECFQCKVVGFQCMHY